MKFDQTFKWIVWKSKKKIITKQKLKETIFRTIFSSSYCAIGLSYSSSGSIFSATSINLYLQI